jgi:CheY-like chemotaxis protein
MVLFGAVSEFHTYFLTCTMLLPTQVSLALETESAAGRGIDAILMDINMPRMGGDEACAALRAAGWTLPIFAVSGTPESQEVTRQYGFTATLSKPFSLEQLRAALAAQRAAGAAPGT